MLHVTCRDHHLLAKRIKHSAVFPNVLVQQPLHRDISPSPNAFENLQARTVIQNFITTDINIAIILITLNTTITTATAAAAAPHLSEPPPADALIHSQVTPVDPPIAIAVGTQARLPNRISTRPTRQHAMNLKTTNHSEWHKHNR